jgi:hypothetical protein
MAALAVKGCFLPPRGCRVGTDFQAQERSGDHCNKFRILLAILVLPVRIELTTSPLPSTLVVTLIALMFIHFLPL